MGGEGRGSTLLKTGVTMAAGVAGAVFFVWPASMYFLVKGLEKPKYEVVKALTNKKSWMHSGHVAEVRRYQPYIIAEATIPEGDIDKALSNGFRQVANYIFGNNTRAGADAGEAEKVAMTSPVGLDVKAGPLSEKVAMTSPVGSELKEGGAKVVWFMMPFKYTAIDQLPRPNNPSVTFKEVPSRTLAAITFCGASPREAAVESKKAELQELCKQAGLATSGDVMLWQYHPPFCPPWQRRNEVLLEVAGPGLDGAAA